MENKFNIEKFNTKEKSKELEQAAQIFFDFLKIEDKPEESDVIFILGSSSIKPIEKAAQLYKDGYSKKISFISIGGTFGGDKIWGMPEYEMYKKTLKKLGIDENAIVAKGLSTNTLNEAKQAIPFLKENNLDVKKMILVSRPIHQRRAFSTFKKQHPEIQYINCPANEPLDFNDLDIRKRLVSEAERLLDYSKKDDIQKQDIPYDILRAAALIRMDLKDSGEYSERQKL